MSAFIFDLTFETNIVLQIFDNIFCGYSAPWYCTVGENFPHDNAERPNVADFKLKRVQIKKSLSFK